MSTKVSHAMMMPLALTPTEVRLVKAEADRALREVLMANEAFIANNRQLPDDVDWKHLRSREDVHVYRTAESITHSPFLLPSRYQHQPQQQPHEQQPEQVEISIPADLPYVVAFGTFSGTPEDIAFGALGHTESITCQRDAFLRDEYDAVKILATIQHPTPQDPFRSLVIKWSTKRIGALVRSRDCVFLEAVGLTTDTDGEQAVYYLLHSIDNILPRVVGLRHLDIVRVDISIAAICRRRDDAMLDHFAHGYLDIGGSVFTEAKNDSIFTQTLLSVVNVMECAYLKKLAWLTHAKQIGRTDDAATQTSRSLSEASSSHSQGEGSSSTLHRSNSSTGSGSWSGSSRVCSNCGGSCSKLGGLLRSRLTCHACCQDICSKCSVEKKLPIETISTEVCEVKLRPHTFCLRCLLEAKQAPTREVAGALLKLMP